MAWQRGNLVYTTRNLSYNYFQWLKLLSRQIAREVSWRSDLLQTAIWGRWEVLVKCPFSFKEMQEIQNFCSFTLPSQPNFWNESPRDVIDHITVSELELGYVYLQILRSKLFKVIENALPGLWNGSNWWTYTK